MAYATLQQFIDKFGRDEAVMLTNLEDPTAEEVDPTVFERVRNDSSALMDSYLAGRYSLPFASPPQVLVPKCLDICRYFLDRNAAREDVRQRYEDVIRWLEMVAKGVVQLGLDTNNTQVKSNTGVGMPDFEAGERVFTNDSLKDFVG